MQNNFRAREADSRPPLEIGEIEALAAIVGKAFTTTSRDDLEAYSRDGTDGYESFPGVLVRPGSTEEVARIVSFCNARSIPLTPQGGRTSLSGGAIPVEDGVALSLERMNRIVEIDEGNGVVIAEAGVITQVLHEAVEALGLYYPPDPGSQGSCTIGGNIAENAGGPHSVKYGVTGKWVLGVEAVLADGKVLVTGGKTRKDVAGYDLTSLLVGSEGTLAIVTRAWLRLIPKPKCAATLVAPFPTVEDAARAVVEVTRRGLVPAALEFVDQASVEVSSARKGVGVAYPEAAARLLIEFDGESDEVVERGVEAAGGIALECGALDVLLATDEAKRRLLWEVRRGIGEAVHDFGPSAELDLAVPRSELAALVEGVRRIASLADLKVVVFGHAGDGNLHVHLFHAADERRDAACFTATSTAVYAEAIRLGGTITGEHGVGLACREVLPLLRSPEYLGVLRAIKGALDPRGILNPGKLLPA